MLGASDRLGFKESLTVSSPTVVSTPILPVKSEKQEPLDYDWGQDPIARAFYGEVPTLAETVLGRYAVNRRYATEDFPLSPEKHVSFRAEIIQHMAAAMTGDGIPGKKWLVKSGEKTSPLRGRFRLIPVGSVVIDGLEVHLSKLVIPQTGDVVPVATCFPEALPAPAVIAFSGHTHHGLRELFVNADSYQRRIAWTLCNAGFATAAIEKIDSGYSSVLFQKKGERWRQGSWADDEDKIATTLIGTGDYSIPARQLMANTALIEAMANDKRVDHRRIGAVGVSLGGWLALQASLVNSRIKAIANFGGMWAYLEPYLNGKVIDRFEGINDFSQLFPGMWLLGDQNRFLFAAAPVPMLTGYGKKDRPYLQYREYFFPKIQSQYARLGYSDDLEVLVHENGHVLPSGAVVEFFERRLSKQ